jgi:peroxiredoxin 2/4
MKYINNNLFRKGLLVLIAGSSLMARDRGFRSGSDCGPRIGDKAPAFTAESNQGKVSFPGDMKGKWVIFFSHPADFTPVCATEFKKFASMVPQFKRLNTELLGISTDDRYMHGRWVEALEKETRRKINFPIIADTDMKVARCYGMIHPNADTTKTVRAVYIIDPDGIVRALMYYPLTNGRSFKEIKRLLIALQTSDKNNVITPADWQPGQNTIPLPVPGKPVPGQPPSGKPASGNAPIKEES